MFESTLWGEHPWVLEDSSFRLHWDLFAVLVDCSIQRMFARLDPP